MVSFNYNTCIICSQIQVKEAQLIFFIKQFMTWILGLITAELRLIEYPVRIFDYAAKTSFTFEYIVYPSICVVFGLYYPEGKSFIKKLMYYFYYCTGITIVEVILEKYTDVINYINWDWYMSWISLFITFYLSRKYYKWFWD